MHAQDGALLVGLRLVHDQRHLGRDVARPRERESDQQVELLVAQPVRPRALDAVPRPAAATVDLAAFHGEVDLRAARIAGDELDLGAEHRAQEHREIVEVRARPFAAERERFCQHVVPGLHRIGVPSRAQAHIVGDVADPGVAAGVELKVAEQRLHGKAARHGADHAAVLGRDREDVLRGLEASRPRHVLRDHFRITRDVLAHMAREQPRIEVVAASRGEADDHRDGAAGIKILDAGGAGRERSEQSAESQ